MHGLTKHGHSSHSKQSRTYKAWADMKSRCDNSKTRRFHRYGGRGITYCQEWSRFDAFIKDMGECKNGMSLDRINNNKSYTPDNCRWVNQKVNCQNTSKSKRWLIHGVEYNSKSEAAQDRSTAEGFYRQWRV